MQDGGPDARPVRHRPGRRRRLVDGNDHLRTAIWLLGYAEVEAALDQMPAGLVANLTPGGTFLALTPNPDLNWDRLARFWAAALDGYAVAPYDDEELERLRAKGIDDPEDDPSVPVSALPRTRPA